MLHTVLSPTPSVTQQAQLVAYCSSWLIVQLPSHPDRSAARPAATLLQTAEFKHQRQVFDSKARKWTQRHAMPGSGSAEAAGADGEAAAAAGGGDDAAAVGGGWGGRRLLPLMSSGWLTVGLCAMMLPSLHP